MNTDIFQDVDEAYATSNDHSKHHFHRWSGGGVTYKKEFMHLYKTEETVIGGIDRIVCNVFLRRYSLMLDKGNEALRKNLITEYNKNIAGNILREKYLQENYFDKDLLLTSC